MIKYKNDDKIIHEISNTKEIVMIDGVSFTPQEGDLDKYSEEAIRAMNGKTYIWYKGFATEFDKDTMYIIEYLTGSYIGVGVDNKNLFAPIDTQIETPNIEPEIDNDVRGDK